MLDTNFFEMIGTYNKDDGSTTSEEVTLKTELQKLEGHTVVQNVDQDLSNKNSTANLSVVEETPLNFQKEDYV